MFNRTDDRDTNNRREYVGTVLADKAPNSRDIQVALQELMPSQRGPLEIREIDEEVVTTNHVGAVTSSKIKTANGIKATWEGETNRLFPPDVVKGEIVYVWQYGDSDKYYWRSSGRSDDLRKTEKVAFVATNSTTTTKARDGDNTYGLIIDTTTQSVNLYTSSGTGEAFRYNLTIDAKESKLFISDNEGNGYLIDSKNRLVQMVNSDGSSVSCDKENVVIACKQDIVLRAGRQIVLSAPNTTFADQENSSGGQGMLAIEAKGVAIKTDSFTVTAPTIGLNGATKTEALVATDMRAEGYSTGSQGGNYKEGSVDVGSGQGSAANNTPDGGKGDGTNRHCAAQEDTHKAFQSVVDAVHILEQKVGATTHIDDAVSHSGTSRMNRNTGE